jgi:hypothetical protein
MFAFGAGARVTGPWGLVHFSPVSTAFPKGETDLPAKVFPNLFLIAF